MQQTVEMNLSEFVEEDNVTSVGDRRGFTKFELLYDLSQYISLALGIPGNILSAIVWLRLHVARKNSSAVYLASLAINDLAFLWFHLAHDKIVYSVRWFHYCVNCLFASTITLEPLLILGFSVERLIAICWPLQVTT